MSIDFDIISILIATSNYEGLIQAIIATENNEIVLDMIADQFARLIRTENIRNLTKLACIFARTKYEKEYREICARIRNITSTFN